MTKIRTRVRGGGYTIRRNKTDYNSIVSEAAEVFRKDNELSEKAKEYQKNILSKMLKYYLAQNLKQIQN